MLATRRTPLPPPQSLPESTGSVRIRSNVIEWAVSWLNQPCPHLASVHSTRPGAVRRVRKAQEPPPCHLRAHTEAPEAQRDTRQSWLCKSSIQSIQAVLSMFTSQLAIGNRRYARARPEMLLRVPKDETPEKQPHWPVFTARGVVFTPRPTAKV